MKRLPLLATIVLALLAAAALAPADARAIGPCGLPNGKPLWVDYGTPELADVFGRTGVIVAVASGDFPAQMRSRGAKTIHWDMYLDRRVGTTTAPFAHERVVERANSLFNFAVQQSGCDKPFIIINELFGATLETPWTANYSQYRANVMTYLRTLAERGARPYLLVPKLPFTASEQAVQWWREAAAYAHILPQSYFHAPTMRSFGAVVANRRMRAAFRRAVTAYTDLGIPAERIGITLGFQTAKGFGGREGLAPDQAWFEVVKWQALSARQVARETGIGMVLSWGWASYRKTPHDLAKRPSACVYLWVRSRQLCPGALAQAGPEFNASLTQGQLRLAAGVQCAVGRRTIRAAEIAALQRVTGDREVAFTALLARLAEAPAKPLPAPRVLAAERAVISARFGGSRAQYLAALSRAGATLTIARAVLRDELRRVEVERGLRVRAPASSAVMTFYRSYPELMTRAVVAKPGPWWLGGRTTGLAFDTFAHPRLFGLATGRKAVLRGFDGSYTVNPRGDATPLGSVPFQQARPSIAAMLRTLEQRAALEDWSVKRQRHLELQMTCRGDALPMPGPVGLAAYLPFLARV